MQDTAEGFGQPIRHMFGTFFRMERQLPSAADRAEIQGLHRRLALAGNLSAYCTRSPESRECDRRAARWTPCNLFALQLSYLLGLLVFVL